MSEPLPRPETQRERWLKYGANVVMTSVIVLVLACLIIWLAQHYNHRLDTTSMGLYSLKPQTINLIQDNKANIKIVSLFTKVKPDTLNGDDSQAAKFDYITPINDLLEEYKRKGKNIDVESIDPIEQSAKVEMLIETVTERYGGEVKKYRGVLEAYPATYEKIAKLAADESAKVQALPLSKVTDEDLKQTLMLTIATVRDFPKSLNRMQETIEKRTKQKPPDLKGAVSGIEQGMSVLSAMVTQISEEFGKAKDDKKVPEEIRKYMADSLARYAEIKKISDDMGKRIKELGELKLDDLRQSLRERNTIVVMGPNEMRTIPFEKVWQIPEDIRGFTPDGKPKPRFAAEQQVTSAILAVTSKIKPKVAFVRPGGGPLTTAGIPGFQAGGPLSEIADRLRQYNFEVVEKDLSGMWAMQAQMQRMPTPPEPSDEEIKDAVWVVLDIPTGRQQPMATPSPIGPKLAAHLKAGGSALVMVVPRAEALSDALDQWGIRIRTDAIIVHEPVASSSGRSGDFIEDAQRDPRIFVLKQYGDHLLTKPVNSLDSVLVPMVPIVTESRTGYKSAKLLPIPQALKVWGETNLEDAMRDPPVVDYKLSTPPSPTDDMSPPLYAGAAVEKDGGGRVVAIGSVQFATDGMLRFWDPDLARQRILVTRFPGNAELFLNSVFWLAKMEPMIAISPASMEVSRIGEMTPATLNLWRVVVLLVGLPGAVIVAGALMYVRRRD